MGAPHVLVDLTPPGTLPLDNVQAVLCAIRLANLDVAGPSCDIIAPKKVELAFLSTFGVCILYTSNFFSLFGCGKKNHVAFSSCKKRRTMNAAGAKRVLPVRAPTHRPGEPLFPSLAPSRARSGPEAKSSL